MSTSDTTTPINGRNVPYSAEILNTADLNFWEENPRVYAAVQGQPEYATASRERRQEIILTQMLKEESTKRAKEGMKRHGGLQEPLIVDLRGNYVIEGNSRLAAALKLAEDDDEAHWGALECRCYNDITEEEKIALLNQVHIRGKVQWTPYAKATTYFRQWESRKKDAKWTKNYIAKVNGVSSSTVSKEIAIIEKMVAENDNDARKYSWYKVVLDNKQLIKAFEKYPNLEPRVMDTIKNARTAEKDETNVRASGKFRDNLSAITKKPKALADYAKGKLSLEEAAEQARISTANQKMRKAREILQAIDKDDIVSMSEKERKDAGLMLKRLQQEIDCISDWLNHEDGENG